ncbi:MAG TPA: insulinase family protein [Caldithrix abyssi]|uniref:Insulinase family protein n=1 Tax=Caldithrix abyssi TaxID=187145 RepID=A0A7V5RNT4_CALAY|nr:insulinase family protein [Caldithrix abyssi]
MTRILLLLTFLTSLGWAAMPEGFSKGRQAGGIQEYTLKSNGLTVLLMEDHSAPVLTFMVTYRVGSRNEVTGTTGSTHLLEHLMFKGTPKYNKANGGHIDNVLGNIGARLNATTWLDRTNYFESIPSDYLETAIDIESDRMRNLLLRKEDKDAEMTVVRNEFERGENSPFSALSKSIWATAFQAFPYHHSTIGWRSDIENVTIPKLREFYDTFYWPNNATVTVIGDFNEENALNLIKKYYGKIPASPKPIPQLYTTEPKQEGPRRVIVKRPGQLGVVAVAWKVPEGTHKDSYALNVLDKILSSGKSSRYYKALQDKNKTVSNFNFYAQLQYPGLFASYAFLAPGATHEEVEEIILKEIDSIKTHGVSAGEVQRAINQVEAETAFGRDGSFSIAAQLNEAIATGDWTLYTSYEENIKKVTPQEVQEVAKKYLNEDQSTTGYFIPQKPGGASARAGAAHRLDDQGIYHYRPPMEEAEASLNAPAFDPPAQRKSSIAQNIKRTTINGIDVVLAPTGVKNVVTFSASLPLGDILNKENSMLADITGRMLDKGTLKHDKFALAGILENMGARLSFDVGKYTLSISGRSLTKDVNTVIGLLAEELRQPAFDATELEKLKKQRVGNFKRMLEDTGTQARDELTRLLYPKGHPNYEAKIEELIADTEKITVDQVKEFYNEHYGPRGMIFVAAGDVKNAGLEKAIGTAFKGWKGGSERPVIQKQANDVKAGFHAVTMEGKTSTSMYMGLPTGLKKTDEDYLPFYLANTILGTGFAGRLMSIIRDDEGLTYGIYSAHAGDIYDGGFWYITATFAPNLLEKGLNSTNRELKRWVEKGVTAEELANVKKRLAGRYKVSLATSAGMARQILSFLQRGLDISYMDEYPSKIQQVTLDQVNRVIKKYVDPDKVVTVVAGSIDKEGKPLETK